MRRIAMLMVICLPLHRNLMYGQYYILLLVALLTACWCWKHVRSGWAGTLIGFAALLKIFPAVFLLFFLRKRDRRAIVAAVAAMAAGGLLSVHVFGWPMHRYYLQTVLPWTLRGEVTPAYTLASSSLSVVLHRLFLFEPQWNPRPWHNLPLLFAVLAPLLQTLILAPALLLARSRKEPLPADRLRAPLEWSALLCATLAVSTSPASYNFTLLIFPATVLCAWLLPRKPLWAAAGLICYLLVGYPGWNTLPADGLRALLHVPRLYFLLLFTALCCATLVRKRRRLPPFSRHRLGWAVGITAAMLFGIITGVRRQSAVASEYAFRLPMPVGALMVAAPQPSPAGVAVVGMFAQGYRVVPVCGPGPDTSVPAIDELSFAVGRASRWMEEAGSRSTVAKLFGDDGNTVISSIPDADSPVPVPGSESLAYLGRSDGRGQLHLLTATGQDTILTPSEFNVSEVAPLSDGSFISRPGLETRFRSCS